MGRTCTCEALVLKTYDIGDADRLCILLTDARGRIAVCAKGVRKLNSKWGSAMQSFQHLRVDLAEHSSGYYLRSAQCLSSFSHIRRDLAKFVLASRGSELLLHFLHDTEPSEKIFALAREYFALCDAEVPELLFQTFQLSLLSELGLLPSFEEGLRHAEEPAVAPSVPLGTGSAKAGVSKHLATCQYSPLLSSYLCSTQSLSERIKAPLSEADCHTLSALCDELLSDHLSFPMRSANVSLVV